MNSRRVLLLTLIYYEKFIGCLVDLEHGQHGANLTSGNEKFADTKSKYRKLRYFQWSFSFYNIFILPNCNIFIECGGFMLNILDFVLFHTSSVCILMKFLPRVLWSPYISYFQICLETHHIAFLILRNLRWVMTSTNIYCIWFFQK